MKQQPIRVRITNIPPETGAEGVAARIVELLPGAVFDGRHGTFSEPPCTITFDVGPEGATVDVGLNHPDGFAALMRVILESRWDAIDPVRNLPVDLDASSRHGALMLSIPVTAAPPKKRIKAEDLWAEEPPPAMEVEGAPTVVDEKPVGRRLPIREAVLAIGLVAILGVGWTAWSWASRVPAVEAPPAAAETRPAAPVSIRPAVDPAAPADTRPPGDVPAPSANAATGAATAPAGAGDTGRTKIRSERFKELAPEFQNDAVVHQLLDYRDAMAEFSASTSERRVLPPERLADRSLVPVLWPDGLLPPSFAQPRRDRYVFHAQGRNCANHGESLQDVDGFCDAIVYVAQPADGETGLRAFAYFTEDNRIHYRAGGQAPTRDDPTVEAVAAPGAGAAAKASASRAAKQLTNALESAAAAAGIRKK